MSKLPLLILGADHAGFELKEHLKARLTKRGFVVQDASPTFTPHDDYPLIAAGLARRLLKKKQALGILVCGSGLGMDIAANRFKHIRAATVRTTEEAELARNHNHTNVLVLGAWISTPAAADALIKTWLDAKPSSATRHVRRVDQLTKLPS